VQCTAG